MTQRLARRAARRRPVDELSRTDPLAMAVLSAQQGNELAFTELYRTIQPGLLRYLGALVGAEAEDVAAETWFQVCRDLAAFSGDGDGFRGWVTTIGRHRAMDHVRARGRRPVAAYPVEYLDTTPAVDDTAAAASEAISTSAALELIRGLPADQAEAVLLRTVLGLDATSAGRVLGKRPGAVRMSAHRGLRNLARQLDARQARSQAPPDGVTAAEPDALNGLS